jgi:hypothetical protein
VAERRTVRLAGTAQFDSEASRKAWETRDRGKGGKDDDDDFWRKQKAIQDRHGSDRDLDNMEDEVHPEKTPGQKAYEQKARADAEKRANTYDPSTRHGSDRDLDNMPDEVHPEKTPGQKAYEQKARADAEKRAKEMPEQSISDYMEGEPTRGKGADVSKWKDADLDRVINSPDYKGGFLAEEAAAERARRKKAGLSARRNFRVARG